MNEEYSLLTSTRYDPFLESCRWNDDYEGPQSFFSLPYHLERLISAAEAHGWPIARSALTYSVLKNACEEAVSIQRSRGEEEFTAFRVRITVSKEGPNYINVTAAAIPCFSTDPTLPSLFDPLFDPEDAPSSLLRVFLDTEATIPSIFTKTKTTARNTYDLPKKRNETILRAVPSGVDSDILLYNQHWELMETTIFNVAFYRNSLWVTPATTSGCLGGVMRRWLLENGRVREGVLAKDAVCEGEWVLLFNGVQGCRFGKLYSANC